MRLYVPVHEIDAAGPAGEHGDGMSPPRVSCSAEPEAVNVTPPAAVIVSVVPVDGARSTRRTPSLLVAVPRVRTHGWLRRMTAAPDALTAHAGSALTAHAGAIKQLAERWLAIVAEDPAVRAAEGDLVCSPAGLWLALTAIAAGAGGDTADELRRLLGVAGPDAASAATGAAAALAATDALAVATGVWSRTPVFAAFKQSLPGVGFGNLDPDDVSAIDAWVADATGGLIERLPAEVDENTLLLLVNALALKARWAEPFDAARTHERPFKSAAGSTCHAQMMSKQIPVTDAWRVPAGDATVVELRCEEQGAGEPARARFVLGPPGAGAAAVLPAGWAQPAAREPIEADEVQLGLPRLSLRTTLDVSSHLAALDIRVATSEAADFSLLSPEPLLIDQVVQEALIRVAEKGVEAAAVTTVAMAAAGLPMERRIVRIDFDRPFGIVLLDGSGTVPLFTAWQARPRPAPSRAKEPGDQVTWLGPRSVRVNLPGQPGDPVVLAARERRAQGTRVAPAMADGNGARSHRPALLAVDDDPGVAAAVRRDLRKRYGDRYQVLSAQSGDEALDLLRQVILREQPVALMVVDQRMPKMSGVEFLEQAMTLAPDAKKVLLTAYADTEAAIKAINDISLDYYLRKPWDPPEEELYPVIDDLLGSWLAEEQARGMSGGVRLVGHRFAPASHKLKDFLARNQVPYRWLELERDPEAQRVLTASGLDASRLPIVVLEDGSVLAAPGPADVAGRLGMTTQASGDFYDLIIVGGGPAGLAGAVYGASEGLRTVLLEREAPGGQAGQSSRIENYLGFPVGLSGADLARRATTQARRFGTEFIAVTDVQTLEVHGPQRRVRLADGNEVCGAAVLIATGVSYRKLDAPGVEKFTGRGIYYGAARTEAIECQGEEVFVVGGANSAGQAAMYLSAYARQVTILYRGDSLQKSMSSYLIDQIDATDNIRVLTEASITEAHGDEKLHELTLNVGGEEQRVNAASAFVFIGAAPRTDWVSGTLARDDRGFLLSGPDVQAFDGKAPKWPLADRPPLLLESNLPGVFIAGDVRHQSMKRVASAVGEGAMAVAFVHQYLGTLP